VVGEEDTVVMAVAFVADTEDMEATIVRSTVARQPFTSQTQSTVNSIVPDGLVITRLTECILAERTGVFPQSLLLSLI